MKIIFFRRKEEKAKMNGRENKRKLPGFSAHSADIA